MTGTDLAVRQPAAVQLSTDQLKFIATSEFVPAALRGNLPAIMACVATGRELGIGDMTALRSVHVIDGKATLSAEVMSLLVRRRGHSITGQVEGGAATVHGRRADNGDEVTVTWTLEMAERAGLAGKSNWRKYPESMLWARAVSQLCRMLFADCFAGATYTPEELEDSGQGAVSAPGGDVLAGRGAGEVLAGDAAPTPPASVSVGEPQAVEGPAASPVSEAGAAPEPPSPTEDPAAGTPFGDWDGVEGNPGDPVPLANAAQKKKLNVLVGRLRTAGRITTDDVYAAAGHPTHIGLDEKGELHWSPLRERLTKAEASALIDWLERAELEANAA